MSATACATAAQSPTLKADHRTELEQQLVKTERDWTEALKNRDKKALSQICSDDLLVTDEEGKVSTKKNISTILCCIPGSHPTLSATSSRELMAIPGL